MTTEPEIQTGMNTAAEPDAVAAGAPVTLDDLKRNAEESLERKEAQLVYAIKRKQELQANVNELRPEVARLKTIVKSFTPRTKKKAES